MTQGLFEHARAFFRTVGPQYLDNESISVKNCVQCRPKATSYSCKKCDFKTWQKWRISVHILTDSRHCNAVANQRAKEWSEN